MAINSPKIDRYRLKFNRKVKLTPGSRSRDRNCPLTKIQDDSGRNCDFAIASFDFINVP